jgi:hypothetical protein
MTAKPDSETLRYRRSDRLRAPENILLLLLITALTGCDAGSPVSSSICTVSQVTQSSARALATLTNTSTSTVVSTEVLFSATGLDRVGSLQAYEFSATIAPGQTVRAKSDIVPSADHAQVRTLFGAVSCSTHYVKFKDGSQWIGPSPL